MKERFADVPLPQTRTRVFGKGFAAYAGVVLIFAGGDFLDLWLKENSKAAWEQGKETTGTVDSVTAEEDCDDYSWYATKYRYVVDGNDRTGVGYTWNREWSVGDHLPVRYLGTRSAMKMNQPADVPALAGGEFFLWSFFGLILGLICWPLLLAIAGASFVCDFVELRIRAGIRRVTGF